MKKLILIFCLMILIQGCSIVSSKSQTKVLSNLELLDMKISAKESEREILIREYNFIVEKGLSPFDCLKNEIGQLDRQIKDLKWQRSFIRIKELIKEKEK